MQEMENAHRGNIIQVYVKEASANIRAFIEQHTASFKNKYGITIRTVERGEDLKEDVPALVYCNNHSRIGTDIDYAISDVSVANNKRVAIVVVHLVLPHAVPTWQPTDNLHDIKYEQYGRLVDYAFHPDTQTIYRCALNKEAERKFETFLKDHYMERGVVERTGWEVISSLWRCLRNLQYRKRCTWLVGLLSLPLVCWLFSGCTKMILNCEPCKTLIAIILWPVRKVSFILTTLYDTVRRVIY